jgi:psiF repeat
MRPLRIATLSAFAVLLGSSICLAQAPSSAPATAKSAVSKACSDQANAKGLHGKARKAFRSKCKREGGKPS